MKCLHRRRRGITLLETLVTAMVLILGIAAVSSTVVSIVRLNRRNLAQSQAYTIAEWWLERVTRVGCDNQINPVTPCAAITAMDGQQTTVYWNASGSPTLTVPPAGSPQVQRPYIVDIDVDPPFEGTEAGDPLIRRPVLSASLQQTLNVRVTVSWRDELGGTLYHAVALQTKVGP